MELSGYVIILVENVDGKIKLYGSPPDRDNLEVGDEILEINGLTLENISRAEIIRHIHDVSNDGFCYLPITIINLFGFLDSISNTDIYHIHSISVYQIVHHLFTGTQKERFTFR